jgi:hypothetical protein
MASERPLSPALRIDLAQQALNQAIVRDEAGSRLRIARWQAAGLLFVRWRVRQGQIGGADDGAAEYGSGEPLVLEDVSE